MRNKSWTEVQLLLRRRQTRQSRVQIRLTKIIEFGNGRKGRSAMNPVSLIVRFTTPEITRRIASAPHLDHVAKRSMLIVCSAICVGLAFPTSSFAQRKALPTCDKEWKANKAFNQAAGITKRDWIAKCRGDKWANKPADARRAEYARERSCAADWKAAKAAGSVTAEMTWPTYWSECDQRKKAMGM